jgi:outer membrane protein OmpA-like peptidoglycan-associated protein
MKSLCFLAAFISAFFVSGQIAAQVKLPVDANNCAIFNALNPDNSLYCTQSQNLGTPRGLIVTLNGLVNTPDASKVVAQLPSNTSNAIIVRRPKTATIDYKAAKSESGYYIHFAFDSEVLEKAYRDHLDRLTIVLNSDAMKQNCVKITGHTDTVGDAQYNLNLSRRRANSVFKYLTASNKVNKNRFTTEAVGEAQPLPDKVGTSPFNRRVEFSSKATTAGCKTNS